jgi:hypothetical protein
MAKIVLKVVVSQNRICLSDDSKFTIIHFYAVFQEEGLGNLITQQSSQTCRPRTIKDNNKLLVLVKKREKKCKSQ